LKYFLILLAALGICLAGCGKGSKGIPTEITFYQNLDVARAAAVDAEIPMIIEFRTAWSNHSDTLETITFDDSVVISMSENALFVRIDAESDTAAAMKYAIAGYPTVVVTKPDGSEIDRILGYLPPNEFYNQVQLYLQGKETLEDYLTRLEDEPDNPEYLMLIGEKYSGRANWPNAIDFFNRVLQLDQDNRRGLGARSLAAIIDVHTRSRNYKAAMDVAAELIRRYPNASEAGSALAITGYLTALSGDEKGAAALYRSYLEKYPNGKIDWVLKRLADIEEKL
jgi:tetratricopeptide (TPR) repeat protein